MNNEEKKKSNKKVLILVLLLSILTIFLGVSVAVFNYFGAGTTNNVIQTGKIIFSYSDADFGSYEGNGVNITNATPVSDAHGKTMLGNKEYFDFNITATTTNTDIAYEIVAKKGNNSTLDENKVKIYLTEISGGSEVETPLTGGATIPTYDKLRNTNNSLLSGKTIYYGTVKAGEVAYRKNFRLRMWLTDENGAVTDETNQEKVFTVKVNVAAVGNN